MKRIFTLLATALLAVSALSGQELTNFAMGGRGPRIVSPEVKDGKVTFRLSANYATRVCHPRPALRQLDGEPVDGLHRHGQG